MGNLEVGARARGFHTGLDLLPGSDPRHAARLTVREKRAATAHEQALRRAIPLRRTNRLPYTGREPDMNVIEALHLAAMAHGADLTILDDDERRGLVALIWTAEHRQRRQAGYREELAQWTTENAARADGVPVEAFGPAADASAVPIRNFAAGGTGKVRRLANFEPEPR